MSDEETDQTIILAILEWDGQTLELHNDGSWYGDERLADDANRFASWEHWTPDQGDAAIWACETLLKMMPGKLTAFFTPADMGNPLGDSEITP